MTSYRFADQDYYFSCPVEDLRFFEITSTEQGTASLAVLIDLFSPQKNLASSEFAYLAPTSHHCQTVGWVGDAQRPVETWYAPPGILMRVEGGSDFYISPGGRDILCASLAHSHDGLNEIDRQILLGPALVLALALRGTWSLHASAAMFKDRLIVFLGESGQGKSTLAASLAAEDNSGWRLVADDILPVTLGPEGVVAWPRFPQLKLPSDAQPGLGLPERLPVSKVCVLTGANAGEKPGLQLLPVGQSVQIYLGHTAGTRLFGPELLTQHLDFCAQAAGRVAVYRLDYPHRRDALPIIKELLESIC